MANSYNSSSGSGNANSTHERRQQFQLWWGQRMWQELRGRIHMHATPITTPDDDERRKSGGSEAPILDDTEKRVIYVNSPQTQKFCNNHISTAKYSFISFLPSFLFEQFRRYSNCFFLLIALLQQIPDVSPTGRYTTLVPLIFILAVSAVKEIVEDFKRHRADNEINHRYVDKLKDGAWISVRWEHLSVGDIVKIQNNTFFPADLIILSSSEPQAMCFIETSNLDGETNLKIRQGIPATAKLLETKDLVELAGVIECELPNRLLYEFNGVLKENGKESVSLGSDQILQRGAVLRNTAWIFGFVVYTGHDTKLMKNTTSAPLKRSTVDRLTNTQILMLFMTLLVLCLTSAVFNFFWTRKYLSSDWYLGLDDFKSKNFGYNLLTFFILYNNLIPISLQVTLELVRYMQAQFINNDIQMYHVDSNTPAMARTSNLNEELGMIKYIFSDKTGTLTRNEMTFKKCSIVRQIYETENTPEQSLVVQHLLSKHQNAATIKEFLVLLSVCHTVIPEKNSDGSIVYHSASPDERALVEGAKAYGFIFDTRTPDYVEINALGTRERYEILNVLEFTSTRKRMSVICKTPNGEIKLYCKGADSVIYERLSKEEQSFRDVTLSHLEEFAAEGLRTLCCAVANIRKNFYNDWQMTYHKASTSINDRERKMEEAANLIEKNLHLLGATAIEDKLQEGVPETIASLLEAGIFIWVLTGDKQETAINIGHSCRLISPTMDIILLNEGSLDATRENIHRHSSELQTSINKNCNVALVIDGKTLKYALSCDLRREFQELCTGCRVVICCRVSPIQKAEVVEMVTSSTKSVTLAIGDGANDVAMIQKANVGVGISGVEGLQAACASDYSIAQFRYLKRLLLVHGSWNYRRITKVILYSFYKNVCLYVIELWFAIYSGWSGQILFERWTIGLYNVMFTAFPPFAIGIFEKVCSAETMLKYPLLYKPSQNAKLFNVKVFWVWIINALLHSVILFWLPLGAIGKEAIWSNGKTSDYLLLGNHVYTYVVATVCVKAGLSSNSWTWMTHASIWGSIGLWLLFICIYSNFWPLLPVAANFVGMEKMIFSTPIFWFGLLLIPITALLADIIFKLVQNTVFKSLTEAVRESEIRKHDTDDVINETRSSFTETARLLRSVFVRRANTRVDTDVELSHGYAFSQEEGGAVSQSKFCRRGNANSTQNRRPVTSPGGDEGQKSIRRKPGMWDDSQKRVITIKRRKIVKFHNNHISSAKYSFMSFLPFFLFEQFRRYTNCFFLLTSLIQQLPDVSPTGRYTTLVPLCFILLVSGVKEIVEDVRRHRADDEINNRNVQKLKHGDWVTVLWRRLYVGAIVKIPNNTFIPADLVLLSSSEPHAMCFIETANLDGETNLKIRQSVPTTANLLETKDLVKLSGVIECDLPNRLLYDFNGVLKERNKASVSLGPDQFLQRGTILRNTAWVVGIVVYTGHETKFMKNAEKPPLKRSTVDRVTNSQIIRLFITLVVMCCTSAVFNSFWSRQHLSSDYIGLKDSKHNHFVHNVLTFSILYNNLIPISLQVTLEVVRYVQAKFINNDIEMYHVQSNTPAMARTSNLNEELGMIKYIFSDKTGTLTRNQMVFKKCSVGRQIYESANTTEQSLLVQHLLTEHEDAATIKDFLVLLAVCHTVIPEKVSGGSMVYHSASPDERALVEGAKAYGFIFDTRTPDYVEIDALGTRERYEILNVLEFTSTRQRMSVICKTPEGEIKLYCKGADSVIYERLSNEDQTFRDVTLTHLEEFAEEGLRTLCCAVAKIHESFYDNWQITYHAASTSINDRESKVNETADIIENNLQLLGATAVDDQLQEGVPDAIDSLLKAGIYIWILTGDKQETAVNIGHSCRLISPTMDIILLNEGSLDATRENIHRHSSELQISINKNCHVALVIDGKTLNYALSSDLRKEFRELCTACRVVICCRASPIQKAEVVEMVSSSTESVTLAIGDGANDVAMIQKAHVGVGISGAEGLQAACAADYSIAQFRYLKRLLLVHGSWNYARITKVILYSFYKNICLYVIELWFAIYSAWSGQNVFESWTISIYNLFFTSLPPLAIGILERHCSADVMLKDPLLYKPSQNSEFFNVTVFWVWIINGLVHSIILFWLPMWAIGNDTIWSNGKTSDYLLFGNLVYTYVVITVCTKAGLSSESWTWVTHASIWGSIGVWFLFVCVYSQFWPKLPMAANFVGMEKMMFSTPIFWYGLLLIPTTALLADIVFLAVQNTIVYSVTAETSRVTQELVKAVSRLPSLFARHSNNHVTTDVELPEGRASSQEEVAAA